MATTKKTESDKAVAKKPTAKKPAAKKPAAKKPAARKPTTKKAADSAESRQAAAVSEGMSKTKETHAPPAKVPGRKERRGVVVSDVMEKTIVVRIDAAQKHRVYGKVVRRSTKLHVHDELNSAGKGDLVRVVETRPLSATKRWRLLEVLEKAR
mgnify:CR=1 FL=1